MALQPEKLEKLRTDRRADRLGTVEEQLLLSVWKGLNSAQNAEKYQKNVSASKARAARKAEDAEIGLETKKSTPVKSIRGASRGGGLSKKLREINNMTTGMVEESDNPQDKTEDATSTK